MALHECDTAKADVAVKPSCRATTQLSKAIGGRVDLDNAATDHAPPGLPPRR
jgi:hypothetical protein